jgi:hypothetical protein
MAASVVRESRLGVGLCHSHIFRAMSDGSMPSSGADR